nr:hypothetical protein TorRG33x02_142890 [Ipomoea batatas]
MARSRFKCPAPKSYGLAAFPVASSVIACSLLLTLLAVVIIADLIAAGLQSNPVGPTASVQAAKMFTPGAIKSGFNISGFSPFGPLAENEATTGAVSIPNKALAVGHTVGKYHSDSAGFLHHHSLGYSRIAPAITDHDLTSNFIGIKTTSAGKFRSIVPAPTVISQGARLVTDIPLGPSLPADEDTNTPLETAPTESIPSRCGGGGVSPVTVGISWGSELNSIVDTAADSTESAGLMALGEKPSSNDFPITILSSELGSRFANPLPTARNGSEIQIRKAPPLRPNSGIEHSNNDIGAIIRVGPETSLVPEAEKLRGPSSMKVPAAVLESGEDGGMAKHGSSLGWI